MKRKYRDEIRKRLPKENSQNINDTWKQIEETIRKAAKKSIP